MQQTQGKQQGDGQMEKLLNTRSKYSVSGMLVYESADRR